MLQTLLKQFEKSPVIPSAHTPEAVARATRTPAAAIFLLGGSILTLPEMIRIAHGAGKRAFVHLDLAEGLGRDEVAVRWCVEKIGADGEVTRSISPDRTFAVKVTLDQMSESNSYFQEMYNRDQQTGDAIESLMIQDMKGGMLFSADEAWVPKPATRGFGKAAGTREWEIHTGEATLEE